MRKWIQVVLLSAFASLCFAEGSLQLLFETPSEKKARLEYKQKWNSLEPITKDRFWYHIVPENQRVDLCNPGDARKAADIPIMYGAVVGASLDTVIPLPAQPLPAMSKNSPELYRRTLKEYGSPETRTKKIKFRVSGIFNGETGSWEQAGSDTVEFAFNLRRGVEIDSVSGEFRHRESNIPILQNRVFTPYGYFDGWLADSTLDRFSCAEGSSIELMPYEVAFPVLSNLEYHYRNIAEEAAKGNFDYVALKSQYILDDITPSENVFKIKGLANIDAVLPLLILSRQYLTLLRVDDNFMNYLDDDYYNHEENRWLEMGEVSSVSPYLRDALQSWQNSSAEQEKIARESPEVRAYVNVFIARAMGVSQEEMNKVVKASVQGVNEIAKAFIVRHFYSATERGGIGNVGFSVGRPFVLGESSRELMEGSVSMDFVMDLEVNRIVYGLLIGGTHYDLKESPDDRLIDLRFNFNLGYRPFIASHVDGYVYGGLILGVQTMDSDTTTSMGFSVGTVLDFFLTERKVVTTPALPGSHSFDPVVPGTVPLRPAVAFSRPGIRLRVEYSLQKLLDEYRNGLDVSLGLVWNFYGYKQVEF